MDLDPSMLVHGERHLKHKLSFQTVRPMVELRVTAVVIWIAANGDVLARGDSDLVAGCALQGEGRADVYPDLIEQYGHLKVVPLSKPLDRAFARLSSIMNDGRSGARLNIRFTDIANCPLLAR